MSNATLMSTASDIDLIVMAAKRLLTDFRNGNLRYVRDQLAAIGGSHSRAVVAHMLHLSDSSDDEAASLRAFFDKAVEMDSLSQARRRVIRNVALLHLDEIKP